MKRIKTRAITLLALCIALNIVGSNIALMLKLPIYLDSIGTVLAAAVFDHWVECWPGCHRSYRGCDDRPVLAVLHARSTADWVSCWSAISANQAGHVAVKLVASWCYFTSRNTFIHGDYGHLISWHHVVWFEHASPIIIRYRYGQSDGRLLDTSGNGLFRSVYHSVRGRTCLPRIAI